jgi:hypothetical protein
MPTYREEDTRIGVSNKQGVLLIGSDDALGFVLFCSEGAESDDPTLPASAAGFWVNSSGALTSRTMIYGATFVGPSDPDQGFVVGDGVNLGGGSESVRSTTRNFNITRVGLAPSRGEPVADVCINTITLSASAHDSPGLLVLSVTQGKYAYFWVDSTGNLRINGVKPADQDADGEIVGSQDSVTDYMATIFATSNLNGLENTDDVQLSVIGGLGRTGVHSNLLLIEREASALVFETYDAGGVMHRYYVWSFGGVPDLRIVENVPTDLTADGVLVSSQ